VKEIADKDWVILSMKLSESLYPAARIEQMWEAKEKLKVKQIPIGAV
jgi:hypothetical protein